MIDLKLPYDRQWNAECHLRRVEVLFQCYGCYDMPTGNSERGRSAQGSY